MKRKKVYRNFPIESDGLKIGPYTLPSVDGGSGQFLSTNGSYVLGWDVPAGGKSLYTAVVGSTAQKNAKIATHDNLQTAINTLSDGDTIFLLNGTYSTGGPFTLNKKLMIVGEGAGCIINTTFTFQSGSDSSIVKFVKFNDNVFINTGAARNIITDCWLLTGKTISDNGTDTLMLGVQ